MMTIGGGLVVRPSYKFFRATPDRPGAAGAALPHVPQNHRAVFQFRFADDEGVLGSHRRGAAQLGFQAAAAERLDQRDTFPPEFRGQSESGRGGGVSQPGEVETGRR